MNFEILDKPFQVPPNKLVNINQKVSIMEGQIIGLWGANGIGKTTLLKKLYSELSSNNYDLIYPSGDNLKFKIGIIPQHVNEILLPWLKVDKIIEIFQDNFIRLNGSIDLTGITNCSKKIRNLSGGEKQILALELMLNFSFNILFLDEPFSAMDLDNIKKYKNKLCSYALNNRTIVFIVIHDLLVLQNLSDFILVFTQKENKVLPFENRYKNDKNISVELLNLLYV